MKRQKRKAKKKSQKEKAKRKAQKEKENTRNSDDETIEKSAGNFFVFVTRNYRRNWIYDGRTDFF